MKNKEYWYARELAQRVLREFNARPPVDVWGMCMRSAICVRYCKDARGWQGLTTIRNGRPYILLCDGLSRERERYVIAHELGHLWHGHVGAWRDIADRSGKIRRIREREATEFAMELLMPRSVLAAMKIHTAEQIRQLCGVRYPTAVYRLKQITEADQVSPFCALSSSSFSRRLSSSSSGLPSATIGDV